ncbi:MAG: PEP-CTERM sorting domain-containing protein [Armatimonadetes bacterium]|nr:PEP-CTERM sorting domain-containing protein [Armatimonadota bacterium]
MIGLAVVPAVSSAQTWLTASPSATTYYGGSLFNFTNDSATDLLLTGRFDLNLSGAGGSSNSYQVYTKSSALSGQETDASAWTLLGTSAVASSNPQGSFTTIDVGNTFVVGAGQTIGLAVFLATGPDSNGNFPSDGFIGYSSGAHSYSDGTATISTGLTKGYRGGFDPGVDQLFDVDTFSPRSWSGRVEYAPVPEPASLAALGLFSIGLFARKRKKS